MRNLFLTIAFVVSLSATPQTTLNLSSGTQTSGFSDQVPVRSVEETSDGYIITYNFATANLMPDDIYTNTYNWEYNNFGVTHETTKPALPIRYEDFAVPEGKYATVSIVGSQYRDFSFELSPAKPACVEGASINAADIPAIASYAGYYPYNLVSVVDNQIFRNIDIATIGISPIQYNMRSKTVRAYTEIKFKIAFEDYADSNSTDGRPNIENQLILKFQCGDGGGGGGISKNIDNGSGNVNIGQPVITPQEYFRKDYLILSTPEFKKEVEKLREWKQTIGFSTHVIYNDSWTINGIKDAVYEFAATHPDFTHLLLFGDYNCLPSIEYHDGPKDSRKYYSDLEYACLIGDDLYPDVFYGRIPVNNTVDANTVVSKTINYEKNPTTNQSFHNTHSFAALLNTETKNGIVYENFKQCTKTCEDIRKWIGGKGYQTTCLYRLYPYSNECSPTHWYNHEPMADYLKRPQFNWNIDAGDISSRINNGTSTILYRGHGDIDCWVANPSDFYNTSNIATLTNGSMTPIVFSITCSTGRLDTAETSFAEAFLNKNEGGCAGIIAATNLSYTSHNNYLADGLYRAIWPKENSTLPIYELGAITQTGFSFASHYSNSLYQRKIYHCYGDPSLRVYTTTPKKVEGATVTRSETMLSVKCETPMYISIYDPDKNETSLTYGTRAIVAYTKDLVTGIVDGDPRSLTVCIYNDNYKPDIYIGLRQHPLYPVFPTIGLNSCAVSSDQTLHAGYDTLDGVGSAQVLVTDVYGNRKIVQECEPDSNETTLDVSSLNKGVYVVSLVVDGQIVGSKSVLK